MGHKISPKDIQDHYKRAEKNTPHQLKLLKRIGDMAQFDRQTIEALREKLSEFAGSISPDSGRNALLRRLNTLLPAAPTRRRKTLGSKHLRYGLTKSMTVSTTSVRKMLVALAVGGGGGGGIASPVGMLPASVLMETIPVSTTAIRKRFIFEFLLKDF